MYESTERGRSRARRSSVLWGTGGRGGDDRRRSLPGRGVRRLLVAGLAVLALALPVAASAAKGPGPAAGPGHGPAGPQRAWQAYVDAHGLGNRHAHFVAPDLLNKAQQSPSQIVQVIVQSDSGTNDALKNVGVLGAMQNLHQLKLVKGIAVSIPAGRLSRLAQVPGLTVTQDAPVTFTAVTGRGPGAGGPGAGGPAAGSAGAGGFSSSQLWPYESGNADLWPSPAPQPTIAVVDSGLDPTAAGVDGRVLANVNLSTMSGNSPGDGLGHGTAVTAVAAGSSPGLAGADPKANVVSLDVLNDQGQANVSDVIAACDWILQNQSQYNIRVANFSLASTVQSNFTDDPLDQAVEKLWFHGITVVAAAGNYGNTGAAGGSGTAVSPVSYWRLGEASGTTGVDAQGLNPGTYKGGYTLGQPGASGDGNTAVAFDGTSGYLDLGSPASLQLSSGTIEAWFKTSGNGKYDAIVSTSGRYYIGVNPNGQLEAWDPGTGKDLLTGVDVADGAWHRVAMTFQSGVTNGTQIYLDGNPVLTTTLTFKGSGYVTIGSDGGSGEYFPGTIDDVAIYGTILSQAQIQQPDGSQFGSGASTGGPSGVVSAPGNDPFVITVGAADLNGTGNPSDDTVAPWSAWGYTHDGFAKPDLVAAGRYMNVPLPGRSYLASKFANRQVGPGVNNLSGTSFAAPVVSGTVAQLLAQHPDWTPDQVKGALMASARPMPNAVPGSAGVGELDAVRSFFAVNPPDPNAPLEQFVSIDPTTGDPAFDTGTWTATAQANPNWDQVSWDTVSWDTVSWDTVSWDTVSWDTVSWDTVSWDTVSWDTVSWDTVSWDTVSWDTVSWDTVSWDTASWDAAASDTSNTVGYPVSSTDLAQIAAAGPVLTQLDGAGS